MLTLNADDDCVGRLFRALHSFKDNRQMVKAFTGVVRTMMTGSF